MKISSFKSLISFVLSLPILLNADITGDLKVCALKVEFQEDSKESTTGNGKFLQSIQGIDCNPYHIDAPPHDNDYFFSQLKATNNYFKSVSYGNFGLDTLASRVLPENNSSYLLPNEMSYYYPYNQDSIAEKRLVDLYIHSLEASYSQDEINFSEYDLIIVFHAGIGQDFSLPFLDPTPEDIPSTFVDSKMIEESIGVNSISIGSSQVSKGIILPESQNHLNFDISNTMFAGEPDPCEYQFGLNGTLSLMIGFAIGLPPLWDIENGKSRIGVFGLMDQGSNNGRGLIPSPPDPWSRIHAGWEKPVDIRSNSQINIPKRSEDNILKVAINENEYFLIENRNNHFKKGISIDSARFKVYQDADEYPSFIEVLIDSVSLKIDDNGVIVGLSNYDLGLPGAGLLIWHIDEQLIDAGIATYEINKYVDNMGVDLEESDGAQDIGNDSFFPFYDPSSGYFGDMWFLENQEYFRANPQSKGSLPSFTRDTYPNTNANNGSESYLSFENISSALDTMSLNVYNDIKPYGYHDSTAFYRFSAKPDSYDKTIIVGGNDSLWFKNSISADLKLFFHDIKAEKLIVGFQETSSESFLHIFEYYENSTEFFEYIFNESFNDIELVESFLIDSLVYPLYKQDFSDFSLFNANEWELHKNTVFGNNFVYQVDGNNNGLISKKIDESESITLENISAFSISGVDLSLDATVNPLVIDKEGYLTAYDNKLYVMSGFPLDEKVLGPLLAKNIFGSETPEIIVKSSDSTKINIFNNKGILLQSISSDKDDELSFLQTIDQRNYLFTRYNIFEFDNEKIYSGNTWASLNGSHGNSRKVYLNYSSNVESEDLILRSYCYPNPIKYNSLAKIRIETNDVNNIVINIYDSAGSFVKKFSKNISSEGFQISEWNFDASKLESGIYFAKLKVKSANKALSDNSNRIIKIAVIK